jgi:hypothetical protein
MDTQLLIWVLVFVGGYSVVVAWLLGVALRNRGDSGPEGPTGGTPDPGTPLPPGGSDRPSSSHPPA